MTRSRAVPATAILLVALGVATAGCSSDPAASLTASVTAEPSAEAVRSPSSTPTPAAVPSPPVVEDPLVEGPLVMAASVPLRLEIPAIGVDSQVMELGLLDDGTLEVPPDGSLAGWYDGGPTPGEQGPAVLAGHVDWTTGPAVFYDLDTLVVGDEVHVSRADATVARFRVTDVQQYPKDEFPTDLVYGDLDHAGLRLITCGGAWDADTQHYEDNTVVFAELVTS